MYNVQCVYLRIRYVCLFFFSHFQHIHFQYLSRLYVTNLHIDAYCFFPLFSAPLPMNEGNYFQIYSIPVLIRPRLPSSEDLSVPRSPSDLGLLSAATAVVSLLLRRRRFMQKRFQIIRFISYSTTGSCSM